MKDLYEWTEEDVQRLPGQEDFTFDRKRSDVLIQLASGPTSAKKRLDLSADISAFANSRGGYLVFGVTDTGEIDGGVSTSLKGKNTAEWLDLLLPGLVEPTIRNVRIAAITPIGTNSKIGPAKALYVIQIPDSEDAPHQAKDLRYYVRISGHNTPAEHWMIEDIRGRSKTPKIEGFVSFDPQKVEHNHSRGIIQAKLWPICHIANRGQVSAHDVSIIVTQRPFSRIVSTPQTQFARIDSGSDLSRLQLFLTFPLHPAQDVSIHLGEAILEIEYGTFVEVNTRTRFTSLEFPTTVYAENLRPTNLDTSFASDRVAMNLRNTLRDLFQWEPTG
jgi:hypothetical protein